MIEGSATMDLVDREYGAIRQIVVPRQIKTRSTSFSAIRNAWRTFRLSHLEKKLEEKKDALLEHEVKTDASSKLSVAEEKKIEKKTAAIARLEEKIMVLSKEEVPSNYVAKRAIKLKDKMIKNLTFNSANAYSVGLDKKDVIFGDEAPEVDMSVNNIAETNDAIEEAINNEVNEEVNVIPSEIDSEQIKDAIDEGFEQVAVEEDVREITPEEVNEAVNGVFDEIAAEEEIGKDEIESAVEESFTGLDEKTVEPEYHEEAPEVGKDEIESALEESFAEIDDKTVEPEYQEEASEVVKDEIENAVEEKFNEVSTEDKEEPVVNIDEIKDVIDSAIQDIQTGIDNEEKSREDIMEERYGMRPMTDEEIEASQEKLGFNFPKVEFKDIFTPAENTELSADEEEREMPVVVPDREDSLENENVIETENEEDLHFDFSEATPTDLAMATTKLTTVGEFEALKARAQQLLQQQKETREDMENAQREAEEAARVAAQAKEDAYKSEQEYQLKIEKLRSFTEAIEEDCQFNLNKTRMAREAADGDRRFAEAQARKIQSNNDLMDEIDSIITPEATNVTRRR